MFRWWNARYAIASAVAAGISVALAVGAVGRPEATLAIGAILMALFSGGATAYELRVSSELEKVSAILDESFESIPDLLAEASRASARAQRIIHRAEGLVPDEVGRHARESLIDVARLESSIRVELKRMKAIERSMQRVDEELGRSTESRVRSTELYDQLFELLLALAEIRGKLEAMSTEEVRTGGFVGEDQEGRSEASVEGADGDGSGAARGTEHARRARTLALITLVGSLSASAATIVVKLIPDSPGVVNCVEYVNHLVALEKQFPGIGSSNLFSGQSPTLRYERAEGECGSPGEILEQLRKASPTSTSPSSATTVVTTKP